MMMIIKQFRHVSFVSRRLFIHQQYNEGTTGAYCASCCSNTDTSGDTWTFDCTLLSAAFAEFVNLFGWEFRESLYVSQPLL